MRRLFKALLPAGFLFFCLACPARADEKKILVVHSYHPDYVWTSSITRGIKRALYDTGSNIRIFYMDTKRRSLPEEKARAGQEALRIVDTWKPDFVITSDDNAQEFFGRHLVGRKDVAMVFCGVNGELSDYGYTNAPNVTGILERPHFFESMELFARIVPSAGRVALLGDDSETARFAFDYILKHQEEYGGLRIVSVDTPSTFDGWKKVIDRLQEGVDSIFVYTYHTVKDGAGESVVSNDIIGWTVGHSRVPLVGTFAFTIDEGALCGVVESAMEQGREAALVAKAVLFGGKLMQDFPPKTASGYQSMFNRAAAARLGLKVSKATEDTIDIVF